MSNKADGRLPMPKGQQATPPVRLLSKRPVER